MILRCTYRWEPGSTGTVLVYTPEPGQSRVRWDRERPWGPRPERLDTCALIVAERAEEPAAAAP